MPRKILQRLQLPLAALGGCGLALVLMFGYLRLDPQEGKYNDDEIRALAQERIDQITPEPDRGPFIYAQVRPAVVLISRQELNPERGQARGIGAGVVFDTNGSILTAYHVVAGSTSVNVRFFDGTTTTGTVAQEMPERDLAVILVPRLPTDLQPATLGGGAEFGAPVLAIGAPFGLDGSVSEGVISGLGRRFTVQETGQTLDNMIQFDAAVNPGNSGGPLVDMNGRVVGIVSGIINPTGDSVFIGLGFAVPIEAASGIVAPLG